MKTLIAFLLLAVSAFAADPVVVIRDDGYYVLKPDSMTLVKVQVVDQRTGSTPNPTPTPPPDTPPSKPLADKVTEWTRQMNDSVGAATLGIGYKAITQKLIDGTIKPTGADIDKTLTPALDMAMDQIPDVFVPGGMTKAQWKEKWKPFRAKVADEFSTLLVSRGAGLTKTDCINFFADVTAGMSAATSGEALPDWLQSILQALLPKLLELIFKLITGGI